MEGIHVLFDDDTLTFLTVNIQAVHVSKFGSHTPDDSCRMPQAVLSGKRGKNFVGN